MLCPRCEDVELQPTFRDGIEIDVCRRCRGLWLDHGELSKLMAPPPLHASAAPIPADQYDPEKVAAEGQLLEERLPEPTNKERKPKPKRKKKGSKDKGSKRRPSKKRKSKSWSTRLGKAIAEVIDELD